MSSNFSQEIFHIVVPTIHKKKTVTERTFLLNMHHLVNAHGLEPRTT